MKTPKVLGYTTAIFTTAISLSLTAPAAFAQESFKNWDPRWSVLSSGISRPQTNEERNALKEAVEDGTIDTRGTRINVNNSDVERTSTGTRSPMSNSKLRWHNPFSTGFDNPTSSRVVRKMEIRRFFVFSLATRIWLRLVRVQAVVKLSLQTTVSDLATIRR